MLISDILKHEDIGKCELLNEQPFEVLALCGAKIHQKFCTFILDEKYINDVMSDNISMVITTEKIKEKIEGLKCGFAITEDPRNFFFSLHNALAFNEEYIRPRKKTIISETASVDDMTSIAEYNVVIGENVIIEPFVKIYENVTIGDNTVIRSGCCIGGEGYEFKRHDDRIMPVIHMGGVEIGNHVEIQNNSCVDKAVYPWDNTVIEDYVKIDNLVHVAHAVKIGKNTMIVAQSGIGGRTVIGTNTWIGFGATIRNGIRIGNHARVNMGSVVTKPVGDGESVTGNFAIPHEKFINRMKKQTLEEM